MMAGNQKGQRLEILSSKYGAGTGMVNATMSCLGAADIFLKARTELAQIMPESYPSAQLTSTELCGILLSQIANAFQVLNQAMPLALAVL